MTPDNKERRRHKRYSVKGCAVQYKPSGFFGLFSKSSERYKVLDVSQNGLNFITKEEFREQTYLLLNITAPFLKEEIIRAKGCVVWVKAAPDLSIYGVGIEFVALGKSDKTRLKFLLDNTVLDKRETIRQVHLDNIEKLRSR